MFDLSKDEKGEWTTVQIQGQTPGKRYGHTMAFCRPYIVLFGGHAGTELSNETWVLSVEKVPFEWVKLNFSKGIPDARIYQSLATCNAGRYTGSIFLFGGRGKDQNPMNDSWSLKRHPDGLWEWNKSLSKGKALPLARYQVKYFENLNSIQAFL